MPDSPASSASGEAMGSQEGPPPSQDRLSVADFDADRLPAWARRPARHVQAFFVRYQDHVVVAIAQRFSAIKGTERAFSIGANTFVALVPLVMLLTSKFTVDGESVLAHRFITKYDLEGRAAAATRALFETPAAGTDQGWLTFSLSILFAVVSALAVTAAMQRAYEAAWGLRPIGIRGQIFGIGGITAILIEVFLLSVIGTIIKGTASGFVHLVVRLAVAVAFWLVIAWLLLGRRIGWRALFPGAVVSAAGSVLVHFLSGVYLPHVIVTNAARYGAIGITFAMMTWFYVIGLVLVVGAVVGAQLGGARLVRRRDVAEN
jgi:membrane protein